ncbi:hypothetical protein ACLKA7_016761 [Drosophila subpalustris]
MSDRKVQVREIADILKISAGSVHTIIHEHLGMKNVFSKWVPRLLTPEQKQQRIDESKSCLDMFTRNKSEFLRRYITMDETWIHHFTPESNRQSAEWHAAGESRPKRPKTQQLAGKVMASVFWDAHGIIFIDYLQKGQTINSDYYMALLERLKDEIAKKRPHMAKKKVLFHQDNAPCHKSMKTMAKLNELGFELLPHPPDSPDLAPSDYWLFADLKKMLRGLFPDFCRLDCGQLGKTEKLKLESRTCYWDNERWTFCWPAASQLMIEAKTGMSLEKEEEKRTQFLFLELSSLRTKFSAN